jgi:DNA (cytosine-5)-methyltransferase 1
LNEPYRVLDLFSGVGGFSLGLERTGGFRTVAFCEIEPYCRAVLRKHWPDVPCYEDVRTLTAERLAADGISVDVICGGFPCQDISNAGKRVGIEGERSGLWSEIARLVGELRPRLVIVENVSALLGRGLGRVLGDLAALRYDAEWHCIPASSVGAPHQRDRFWLVAHAQDNGTGWWQQQPEGGEGEGHVADAGGAGLEGQRQPIGVSPAFPISCFLSEALADAALMLRDGGDYHGDRSPEGCGSVPEPRDGRCDARAQRGWWRTEPDVGRVAHGVPSRVDRLRALGNAVVPQIPEIIGRAILQAEGRLT